MAENYYETTESSGFPKNGYFYDHQIRNCILQFMAIFAGLQVRIGKRDTHETVDVETCDGPVPEPIIEDEQLISVPIHYGHQDRVVAAILAENVQNKPLRLPTMSAYMRGLEHGDNPGIGVERRESYLPTGGLLPDDIKVVRQRRSYAYEMEMELSLYASNTDQHFQMLEQILMIFNPSLQIQTSDALFDMGKITMVTLKGISLETNYPIGTDRRIIQSTLNFTVILYLSSPATIRDDYVKKIFARVGAVSNTSVSNYDIVAELDALGIDYQLLLDADDLTFS